jgi:hypothetical protein
VVLGVEDVSTWDILLFNTPLVHQYQAFDLNKNQDQQSLKKWTHLQTKIFAISSPKTCVWWPLTGCFPINTLTLPSLFPLPDWEHWSRLVLPYHRRFAGLVYSETTPHSTETSFDLSDSIMKSVLFRWRSFETTPARPSILSRKQLNPMWDINSWLDGVERPTLLLVLERDSCDKEVELSALLAF